MVLFDASIYGCWEAFEVSTFLKNYIRRDSFPAPTVSCSKAFADDWLMSADRETQLS